MSPNNVIYFPECLLTTPSQCTNTERGVFAVFSLMTHKTQRVLWVAMSSTATSFHREFDTKMLLGNQMGF